LFIFFSQNYKLDSVVESLTDLPNVREALLYERLSKERVRCGLCERRCTVPLGKTGYCRTRMNIDGRLFTLAYGNLSAIESRPIEIKPFFHYWPGSTALTFSTWSCNFGCVWCQNWRLSKIPPEPRRSQHYSPEEIVDLAVRRSDEGLCSSFQEPTVLTDWNVQLSTLGQRRGLYSCYVSNGYMTLDALKLLRESGMDGLKIDLKGDAETYTKYCGGVDVGKVWRNAREAVSMGFHVELVNLVITDVNDEEECIAGLIERHLKEVGPKTPLHFTRYYPAYRFDNPPTKVEILEKAYETARKMGVLYPYIGNVHGHTYENTYCPNCGTWLIKRLAYRIIRYRITEEKRCPKCGYTIEITGEYVKKRSPHI